jgi:DUF1680 family protein
MIDLRQSPHAHWRPVEGATIDGGFWEDRRRLNREVLIPDGARRLEEAGNIHDMAVAAGREAGDFVGMVFHDSDLYKWLEAVGYEGSDAGDHVIELIEAAQEDDGYLNSYYQVAKPGARWENLAWNHEMYCAGHLIQGALAHARVRGDNRLLGVARRFADLLAEVFADRGTPGHPEIEMALVELYRHTGERRYLELCQGLVDRRGHATLQPARMGSSYFQDRVPVREQDEVEGHAVRALYLGAGVTDLYLETGEAALLEAMERQWRDMAGRKAYITGGVGAHHMDEAFGDAYELPPDRCYGETCAAIASIMWSWRMLMVSGDPRYADLLERTLYNGFIAGLALDGSGYSYVNPLHVRDDHRDPVERGARRQPWYECACCPPNVMRLLASLPHYLASQDDEGNLQIHQYMDATLPGVTMRTHYPWGGKVEIESERALALRIPAWGTTKLDGEVVPPGYARVEPGRVTLELDLTPRIVRPHPKIDAVRGCVAIERGPLVYCVEGEVDDVRIDSSAVPRELDQDELLGGIVSIEFDGVRAPAADGDWPYGEFNGGGEPATFQAVPYGWWGNRGDGGMRVWIPVTP